jgi:hypothetical protein
VVDEDEEDDEVGMDDVVDVTLVVDDENAAVPTSAIDCQVGLTVVARLVSLSACCCVELATVDGADLTSRSLVSPILVSIVFVSSDNDSGAVVIDEEEEDEGVAPTADVTMLRHAAGVNMRGAPPVAGTAMGRTVTREPGGKPANNPDGAPPTPLPPVLFIPAENDAAAC